MATVDDKKIIFSMVGVSKTIEQNQKQILKNIYLSFFYGAKIGIIGLNGAGKSTLMKIIAGLETKYQGKVVFAPGYSVGYLPQAPQLDPSKTVREVVQEGVQHVVDTLAEYEEINQKFGLPEYYEDQDKMDALFARQAQLQDIIDATDAWNLDSRLERAMDALNCPPADQPTAHLSGGERRRVALCRLLLQKPDVLLLDEPTNHLDAESIDWLEQHLQQYEGTVIAVTHDRYFLDHVAGWILELDRGEGIPWQGNYSSWLEQKTQRLAMEEKTESKRQKTLQRELEWVRMAPKARQAKGKARLNSYDKLLNEGVKEKEEKLEIFIPNGPRLGNKVIEAHHVAKAFGDKLLFDDLNFMLPPNGIVGVIGPNGAGKTTLFRLIMGLEKPDSGNFEVGETVKAVYVDQQHTSIDPNKSVYDVISGGVELLRLGLPVALQLLGGGPAKIVRRAERRRAQPPAAGTGSEARGQRAAARRAHQRHRREHPARTRGSTRRFCRVRGNHQSRPLVPGPCLHPHPGLRGELQRLFLRRVLLRLRGAQAQAPWKDRAHTHTVPQTH